MKLYTATLAVMFSPVLVFAQQSAPTQKLPTNTQVEVLRLQKQQVQVSDDENALKNLFQIDLNKSADLSAQITKLENDAMKSLGLDPTKNTVNQDTFEITPNPEPKKGATPTTEKK